MDGRETCEVCDGPNADVAYFKTQTTRRNHAMTKPGTAEEALQRRKRAKRRKNLKRSLRLLRKPDAPRTGELIRPPTARSAVEEKPE
jgi:hypothetical protein